jgi:HTH-type transcriptional repressor of NAD biosynthesis genes
VFEYQESEFPNSSVSSESISQVWSVKFKELFPDYTFLITSEQYGDYVAKFMNIKHILFDMNRIEFPVSATFIKNDLFAYWHFLPDGVKPDWATKVAVLGTESTGKTTLTKKLAQHYHCSFVPEAGRELIPDSKSFTYQDLCDVATEHARNIKAATLGESPLIIIDTDVYITESYSWFAFKKALTVNEDIYKTNQSNLYLYLNNDVDFLQDGTRLDEFQRNLLDISHRRILAAHHIKFVEITGNWEQRFKQAVKEIDKLQNVQPSAVQFPTSEYRNNI